MSKGLEAFNYIFDTIPMPDVDKETKQKIYCAMDDIEKALKALEIIKNLIKFGDDLNSILDFDTYEKYCEYSDGYGYELTQEEFDLLKEVLGKC